MSSAMRSSKKASGFGPPEGGGGILDVAPPLGMTEAVPPDASWFTRSDATGCVQVRVFLCAKKGVSV